MNGAEEPRVEIHDALRRETPSAMIPIGATEEQALQGFTLDECWSRGRFKASLFAPTNDRSFQWRADFIRDGLPMLPQDRQGREIDPAIFWPTVAKMNGTPQRAMQRRVNYDADTFDRIIRVSEQQNILFRLPHWTAAGEEPTISDLVYWSDSGILHRLLNVSTIAELDELNEPARGKSYEGFAINALVGAGGIGLRSSVWRRGEDEIDLILEWPERGDRWAIEVTYAQTKAPSEGFQRGCDVTKPTRSIIIQRRELRDQVRGVERMTLESALNEILSQRS